MNRNHVLTLALVLLSAPLAYAHNDGTPAGLPKLYCEDTAANLGDRLVHDYGPVASGRLLWLGEDGAIPPSPSPFADAPVPACSHDDLMFNDGDGHFEWASGGAWLLACEEACGTGTGKGSDFCFGVVSDHEPFPTVTVYDSVLSAAGQGVSFSVYVDLASNTLPPSVDPTQDCGDFESDFGVDCVDACDVDFGPGNDGSYQVFVQGTMGHVWTS